MISGASKYQSVQIMNPLAIMMTPIVFPMIRSIMIRTVIATLALRKIMNQATIGPLEVYILRFIVDNSERGVHCICIRNRRVSNEKTVQAVPHRDS